MGTPDEETVTESNGRPDSDPEGGVSDPTFDPGPTFDEKGEGERPMSGPT